MNFNVDRIAVLAGLGAGGHSGLMKEGAPAPVKAAPPAKPAAPAPPARQQASKPAAPAPSPDAMKEDEYEEGYSAHEMYHMDADEGMYEYGDSMGGMDYDDMVFEVDEMQIMEALVDMRDRRLQETKVRSAVREELSSILNSQESGSRWIYGNRRPSNSGTGKVSRGFLGPGFR